MENMMNLNENELEAAAGGAAQQKTVVGTANYVVKRGDCLDTIARRHSMSGWRELYNFMDNARRIGTNPNLLQVGMVLIVPVYAMG